ncbi:MAG TPA: hypothetical protein VKI20_01475 [Acidimicrobiales bacterium]|nr:hypothetical protein [Acidimicrobiales bacterium]
MSGLTRAASASALLLALAGLAGCSSSHKRPAAAQSAAGLVTSTAPGPSSAVGASAGTTTTVPASLAATGAPIPPPPERGGSPAVAPAGSVALGTKPARVVLSWPLAYVLGQPQGDRFDVVRVDLPTRSVTARATLQGTPTGAAVSATGLYVVAGGTGGSPTTLIRLDPVSLAVQNQVARPGLGSQVVARADGVYLAPGVALERRDPQSLAAKGSVPLPAHDDVADLAADPRASVLWVALPAQDPPLTLVEVDLGSFRVLRSRRDLGGVHGGKVSGLGDDAWVGFATGTQSTAERVRASDAATIATFQAAMPNRAVYTVSGTKLWFSGGQAAGLGCADLSTGAVQGTSEVAADTSPFAADTHVAVLGDQVGGAVRLLVPAPACR